MSLATDSAGKKRAATTGWIERRPAVPAAAALIAGIFAHPHVPHRPVLWIVVLSWLLLIALLAQRLKIASDWPVRCCLAALLCAIFFAGVAVAQLEAFFFARNHISLFATDQPRLSQLELHVDHPPRVLTSPFASHRPLPPKQVLTASVQAVKTWSGWRRASGQVLVQIAQPHPRLRQGQVIRIMGMLERPGPAMNPGQFDWAGYYREQRILASVQVAQADCIAIVRAQPVGPVAWLREQARRALARGFAASRALDHALLRALLLGDNDPELRDVQEQFRRTGTSHHLAISGMHVAVLGGVVFGACRIGRVGPRAACWLALGFVVLYGIVALPSPPVVRSVLLCACFAFGILQRRTTDPFQLLAISVIAMLVYHPMDLYNAGFQLSFGTVLGLMLFTRPLAEALPGYDFDQRLARSMQRPGRVWILWIKLRQWSCAVLAASIVAWVVSMPLVAVHFEQLNPWAIVGSILLAPIVFLALVGGFAKVLLTLLWPSLADTWAALAARPVAGMRHTVDWLARFPGADVPFPAPPIWMIILFYALLLLWLVPWHTPALRWSLRSGSLAACAGLALLLPFSAGPTLARPAGDELRLTLLAIGAGQCAILEPPGRGDVILIDAGSVTLSDMLRKAIGPFLRHRGRRDIRAVFVSHANYDHFSAVGEVVTAYDVPQVYAAPQFTIHAIDNPLAEQLLRTLDQLDRPPRPVARGQRLVFDGVRIDVLWPAPDCTLDANNCSLVLRVGWAGRSILLSGDVQSPAMRELLGSPEQLSADVLVAPHHGSLEDLTDSFVSAIGPRVIVCSNDRTLSARQREFDRAMAGRLVYRTHRCGAITLIIRRDGQIAIEPFVHPTP
ncbi:ComEC/Rec2 family competence protein [Fontivita pretiosa]|uniref:ComEC/Rec2 family competence protein n=1 Tax=Fontivita pretiosa TaxID=2989684 RepID=UPI003D1852DE